MSETNLGPVVVKEPDAPTPARAEYVRSEVSAFPWPGTEIPAANIMQRACQIWVTVPARRHERQSMLLPSLLTLAEIAMIAPNMTTTATTTVIAAAQTAAPPEWTRCVHRNFASSELWVKISTNYLISLVSTEGLEPSTP